jgi:anti-sigma B factor antagonist
MTEIHPLTMEVNLIQGLPVIELFGEINSFAQATLDEAYQRAESFPGEAILLDFSRVEYINSTGIALIVNLLRRARSSDRKLLACGLSSHFLEVFKITRLSDFISLYPDIDQALAAQ